MYKLTLLLMTTLFGGCSSTITVPATMVKESLKACENHGGLNSLTVFQSPSGATIKLKASNCNNRAWFYSKEAKE